ncbi:hypothetical protein PIB30_031384 [Stylosanthes scabra]|uniref:Uncharacterized protein n=1 Tax=Stylosanthes scabra TaxID=79078 RepID=A0ABU6X9M7_9FABA|nr:hypothetical protein [Stylosanthes scabra]
MVTWDQSVLILSIPRCRPVDEIQETLRTYHNFPAHMSRFLTTTKENITKKKEDVDDDAKEAKTYIEEEECIGVKGGSDEEKEKKDAKNNTLKKCEEAHEVPALN